ncbi:hypothetical protein F0562_011283 [Nyssa sinensis]|uniref:Uncharacterized protein n=1 Tax=Nyssa sinensis TaxID=561372 RepID=A0A5J5A343_9ASTE|nr:hypothetical protein F0562_011283 [Nyssa sinensis]
MEWRNWPAESVKGKIQVDSSVFLIKSSGLISNPPLGNDINREHVKNNGDDQQIVRELSEMKALATEEVAMEVEEEQGQENGNLVAVVDAENGLLVTEAADEEDDEFIIIEEEEEEGEEGIGLLSAEELNKKCDDFIKKMKEEIRIEAQHPILVQCL